MGAEVVTAKTAGFCFGVKKAVDQAFNLADSECGALYTYGPIIHNDEVVRRLLAQGVRILEDEAALREVVEAAGSAEKRYGAGGMDAAAPDKRPADARITDKHHADAAPAGKHPDVAHSKDTRPTVILRSHGVPKRVIDYLESHRDAVSYVDVTCPFVKRIHQIVYEKSGDHEIVIVGNPAHPEVEGILGWCRRPATVIQTAAEARAYQPPGSEALNGPLPVCVVAQTTFHLKNFQEILALFEKKEYSVSIVNTICNATAQHQDEAREIAEAADLMIVIGDTKSSNSRKLYEICKERCERTYFIQTLSELEATDLKAQGQQRVTRIGITAGASTPNYIIEEVQKYVGRIF